MGTFRSLYISRNALDIKDEQIKSSQAQSAEALVRMINDFEEQRASEKLNYNVALCALKDDLQEAKLEIDRIRAMETEFLAKLREQDRVSDTLQEQVRGLTEINVQLTVEKAAMAAENKMTSQELEHMRAEARELQTRISTSDVEKQVVLDNLTRLETKQSISTAAVGTQTNCATLCSEDLNNDLAVCKASLAALRLDHAVCKHGKEEMQVLLSQAKSELAELKDCTEHKLLKLSLDYQNSSSSWLCERQCLQDQTHLLNKQLSELVHTNELALTALTQSHHYAVSELNAKIAGYVECVRENASSSTASAVLISEKNSIIAALEQDVISLSNGKIQAETMIAQLSASSLEEVKKASLHARLEAEAEWLSKAARLEEQLNSCECRRLETVRQLELTKSELQGGKLAVDKLVAMNTLNINLQSKITELDLKIMTTSTMMSDAQQQSVQNERDLRSTISCLERRCTNIQEECERLLKDSAAQVEYEKCAVELICKEKESVTALLRECQLESVSLRDAAISWQKQCNHSAEQVSELKSCLAAMEARQHDLTLELDVCRQNVDMLNEDLGSKNAKISLLADDVDGKQSELEMYRRRETEIVAVMALQTIALQEAEKRENEHHIQRSLFVGSESQVRDVASRAIKAEERALKRILELESELQILNKRLEKANEVDAVRTAAIEKKEKDFAHVTDQLEKLLLGELSPEKVASDLNMVCSAQKSAVLGADTAQDQSCTVEDEITNPLYLRWHDTLVELLLELHQAIVITIQRFQGEFMSAGMSSVKLSSQSSFSCLISLSESFNALQGVVLKFPTDHNQGPLPTLPAPHTVALSNGEIQHCSHSFVASATQVYTRIDKDKENETPPRKLLSTGKNDDLQLGRRPVQRQLFADEILRPCAQLIDGETVSECIIFTTFSDSCCSAHQSIPDNAMSCFSNAVVGGSDRNTNNNDSDYWNLSSDGEDNDSVLMFIQDN
jgi:hypothetical protein